MNQRQKAEMALGIFRILGWGFMTLGSLIFAGFLISTFNPESEIIINGVATIDFDQKLKASLFAALFPIAGTLIVFMPRKKMQQIIKRSYRVSFDDEK